MSNQHLLSDQDVLVTFDSKPISVEETVLRTRRWGWWYFAEYQLSNMRQWLPSIAVAGIGTPLVYLLSLGLGLGTMVDSSAGTIDGVSYLQFVAPALLVATVTMGAMTEMTYPVMGGFRWHRIYFGAQATPVKARDIAVGHFAAAMVRFLGQGVVFYGFMVLFGAAPSQWSWLTVLIGVLCAASLGAPLMAFSAHMENAEAHFALIQRFIVTPMFLFAGTFFELSSMPVYLRPIGWLSPIWHGTELARMATYGAQISPWMICGHLAFLVGTTAVGGWLTISAFERRLET